MHRLALAVLALSVSGCATLMSSTRIYPLAMRCQTAAECEQIVDEANATLRSCPTCRNELDAVAIASTRRELIRSIEAQRAAEERLAKALRDLEARCAIGLARAADAK